MCATSANARKISREILMVMEKKTGRRVIATLGKTKTKKAKVALARRIIRKKKMKMMTMRMTMTMLGHKNRTYSVQSFSPIHQYPQSLQKCMLNKHAGVIGRCRKASKLVIKPKEIKKWIPFDIIAAPILPRLPVKSLARFRCVDKQWRSLTYEPHFAMEQLNKAPETTSCLTFCHGQIRPPAKMPLYIFGQIKGKYEFQDRSYDFKLRGMEFYGLSNPVNGLVCAFCCYQTRSEYCYPYLFNPITRQIQQLPRVRNEGVRNNSVLLGFDDSTGVYKVLRSLFIPGNEDFQGHRCLDVLTVGTEEWRRVGEVPCSVCSEQALLLNGSIYWLVLRRKQHSPVLAIVAFDIKEEKLRCISVPKVLANYFVAPLPDIQKLEGHLCVVQHPCPPDHNSPIPPPDPPVLKIWRLIDYRGHKWRQEYAIDMSSWAEGMEIYQHRSRVIGAMDGKL